MEYMSFIKIIIVSDRKVIIIISTVNVTFKKMMTGFADSLEEAYYFRQYWRYEQDQPFEIIQQQGRTCTSQQ